LLGSLYLSREKLQRIQKTYEFVEFSHIPRHKVEHTVDAALKKRESILNRIGMVVANRVREVVINLLVPADAILAEADTRYEFQSQRDH
jgi:hypothetical protein